MNLSLLLTIGLIHLVALASPGPDMALVLRLSPRRRAALGAALGIATGILVHSLLSLTGVSLLLQGHPLLFNTVRLAGAGYLGWLGWQSLSAARQTASTAGPAFEHELPGRGFWTGFSTNLLNPKALVFFIGLLAALVSPEESWLTRSLLVLELFVLSLLWFAGLAWWLSSAAMQARLLAWSRPINVLCGLLFCSVSGSMLWVLATPLVG
ncbi:LysE family translocator [Oceanimonas sp. CHS3-5]|uniref:LysE family translocator n=1 Tax=Oceanimonas sp. CHS3-5 TaxID=3068186 RepID=UPI00273E7C1B|nr:LysE family translocator [Oceanimonas sp. CHS3-5]MDP5292965.1 LysE family translocator [Oceanimonas sp. CHS3-5]